MEQALHRILKDYFGFETFRPLQLDIMKAAMEGSDVLALMPTGGGKSLCYQVPGLLKDGLCLVISPLIALMSDQVQNLRKKNITAFAIHTGMSRKEIINTLEVAGNSNCKFLYVSPERLETNLFKEYLPSLNVNFIAVDEAHCISQWGYDFRPPYLRIAALREELPEVPVIALTASATSLVQDDICDKLSTDGKNNFQIFRQSFDRPNLSYSVFNVHSRIHKITGILKSVQGPAIVYCKTRKRTKEISDLLRMQGFSADYYNAGLSGDERTRKQQEWIENKTRVIVCTNAFGMGIDKPDVRVVIHADVPDCLENYYQEAGRAGRDGKKAFAVLLYDEPELEVLKKLPDIRYPSIDWIRKIYFSVVNYLQIPEGERPGECYDFDLKNFIKNFSLNDVNAVIYGLKALEQDGWLTFNEQIFIPSTLRFTAYRDELYEYEQRNATLEPIIKTLLRTYEGIYDYPVAISESYLSYLLKCDNDLIKLQLHQLHFDTMVEYTPQKDKPQLMLSRTRINTSLLHVDNESYLNRKKTFTERIAKMRQYTTAQTECRSKIISEYFGDVLAKDCTICDNCLKKNKASLSRETFDYIASMAKEILQSPIEIQYLLDKLHLINKEHIWTVINFLVDENKIEIYTDGKLKWIG